MIGATLFSGIGAPECAAPFIDWRWASEIDDFASAVHAHRFPGVPNLGDVTKLKGQDIERPDVIVFGSPCQSFSVAGKRLGLGDPRGNLALVALSLVAELRPRWFVFENVPGLLSSANGEDFAAFLRAVRQCGYTGAYRVLDAQHFGVPQRRRRVFFVGHLGDDWRPSAAVLFEPESLSGHPPPRREAGEGAAGRSCEGVALRGRDGGGTAELTGDLQPALRCAGGGGDKPHVLCEELSDTLSVGANQTTGNKSPTVVCTTGHHTHVLTAEGFDASEDGTGRGTPIITSTGDISHCLNAGGMGRQDFETETLVAFAMQERAVSENPDNGPQGKGWQEDCAFTLEARNKVQAVAGPMVRRLTPTECERLQGFPDGWTDISWRGKPAPDGRRYKALGNSMAVPVLRWILERLWIVDIETRAWRDAA